MLSKRYYIRGGYQLKQVFNVDKPRLYWNVWKNLIAKYEKSASGYKVPKEQLTLLLGANPEGVLSYNYF